MGAAEQPGEQGPLHLSVASRGQALSPLGQPSWWPPGALSPGTTAPWTEPCALPPRRWGPAVTLQVWRAEVAPERCGLPSSVALWPCIPMTFLTLPSSSPLCFSGAGLGVENLRQRSPPKAGLATATKAARAFLKADFCLHQFWPRDSLPPPPAPPSEVLFLQRLLDRCLCAEIGTVMLGDGLMTGEENKGNK